MSEHFNVSRSSEYFRVVYTFDQNTSLILTSTIGCNTAESLLKSSSIHLSSLYAGMTSEIVFFIEFRIVQ